MARPYAKLRSLMIEQDLRIKDLANELGFDDTSVISHRLNHMTPWKVTEMYKILDLLGVPPEQMHVVFPRGGQNEPDVIRTRPGGKGA